MAINSLMHLSKAQLEQAAEHFNVGGSTKQEIVDELHEKEITVADVKSALNISDGSQQESEPIEGRDAQRVFQENSQKVFVKMTRQNPTYQVGPHTFSKAHPYKLMTRAEAEYFISQEEGFVIAPQEEVARYYNN